MSAVTIRVDERALTDTVHEQKLMTVASAFLDACRHGRPRKEQSTAMIYQIEANANLDEIEARLRESAVKHHFGVIAVHDLNATLKAKGVDLNMECRIYEVCNPQQAKKVLEADGAISTALPCRISVYGAPGHYRLATMLPTEMMKGFNNGSIEPIAREVEGVIVQMMKDAAHSVE